MSINYMSLKESVGIFFIIYYSNRKWNLGVARLLNLFYWYRYSLDIPTSSSLETLLILVKKAYSNLNQAGPSILFTLLRFSITSNTDYNYKDSIVGYIDL